MKRMIIKVGTSTLIQGGAHKLSRRHMLGLVQQIVELRNRGFEIILVSSGAVATGKELFHLADGSASSQSKQLLASVGQVKLMQAWSELFALFDIHIGQLLLTKEDFSVHKKSLTSNVLNSLIEHRVIPIINENDPVSAKDACVGDNDNLAALVACMIEADTIILLTDQEGLYTSNPRSHSDAELISVVKRFDDEILNCAGDSSTSLGTGGMMTKIEAAKAASRSGIRTIIASSARTNVLIDLAEGRQIGTVFLEDKAILRKTDA